ncbi:MAG: response regulator [Acidobacteriota bacterium]|jgi:two-component system cell cycle response regulator DivK
MAKKVLVVDDNPISRELIREVLENSDLIVVEAENGEEALNMIMLERPDLVLLDIQLPVFDGYEVLRRVRSDPRLGKLPVIALTAYAMQQDREKALAAGFDDYVTKPIDTAAMRVRVQMILDDGI